MDLHQRLRLAAESAAAFEYKAMVLPRGEPSDLVPKHDQRHLIANWDNISPAEQTKLADQIKNLFPLAEKDGGAPASAAASTLGVTNIFHDSLRMSATLPARFEAPDPAKDMIDVEALSPEERGAIEANGIEVLAEGKGAVLILAGGSGTRLGVSFPKGMLVCPDTAAPRSLFQWHCERVLSLEREFAARHNNKKDGDGQQEPKKIPVVIMLSPQNEAQTMDFFGKNKNFGLADDQLFFFTQGCMPCFNPNGKIILGGGGSVAMAPGGNAGIYPAVYQSGVLDKLRARGVELIQIVTVDNLLVSVADPVLFGSAVTKKPISASTPELTTTQYTDVVAKSCKKLHDNEAVGVFARRVYPQDRDPETCPLRWGVVEYSEVGPELAAKKRADGSGERMFNAGNIAVHLFSVNFVERAAQRMLSDFTYYHVAKKPVGTTIPLEQREKLYGADYKGEAAWANATETSTPGIKLEAFIFDLFQYANSFKLLNVKRSEEFSAIKNADDSGMAAFFSRSTVMGSPSPSEAGAQGGQQQQQQIKKDSPQTAVLDLHSLHAQWLTAFLVAAGDANGKELAALIDKEMLRVEIDPLAAARGDSLAVRQVAVKVGDEVLAEIKNKCESGAGYGVVVHVQANGEVAAVDMLKRQEEEQQQQQSSL